jgi:hypothetical protein
LLNVDGRQGFYWYSVGTDEAFNFPLAASMLDESTRIILPETFTHVELIAALKVFPDAFHEFQNGETFSKPRSRAFA